MPIATTGSYVHSRRVKERPHLRVILRCKDKKDKEEEVVYRLFAMYITAAFEIYHHHTSHIFDEKNKVPLWVASRTRHEI